MHTPQARKRGDRFSDVFDRVVKVLSYQDEIAILGNAGCRSPEEVRVEWVGDSGCREGGHEWA
jgi:hypothetical protein